MRRARHGVDADERTRRLTRLQADVLRLIIETTEALVSMPSYEAIARKVGGSANGILASYRALEAKGYILMVGRRSVARAAMAPIPLRAPDGTPLAAAWRATPREIARLRDLERAAAAERASDVLEVMLRVLLGKPVTRHAAAALVDLVGASVREGIDAEGAVRELVHRIQGKSGRVTQVHTEIGPLRIFEAE